MTGLVSNTDVYRGICKQGIRTGACGMVRVKDGGRLGCILMLHEGAAEAIPGLNFATECKVLHARCGALLCYTRGTKSALLVAVVQVSCKRQRYLDWVWDASA